MINLVEKEFFKIAKSEIDKFIKSTDKDAPGIRVMRVGSSRRYSVYFISKDLKLLLSSSRKESRTFAKVETAATLIKSHGIGCFTVVDLSVN